MKELAGLMKQAREMQAKMAEAQKRLEEITLEASSGGGKVTAVVNGRQEILEIRIDPEVVDPEDVEMLEDLVLAAVKEAMHQAGERAREEMAKAAGPLASLGGLGGGLPGF
ncbi:MAG: YbaB/EbfC family nucleoid-associated protein [Candidatus Eisenbacteria bacterium]|nr:YbaB/EbfC family nucleoid-associated protein [Candidatus Eisenbacteria bacterium]